MEELMTEFRDVFLTKGAYDLHSQVPYLSRLAGHYKAKGVADNNNWVDLLKVRYSPSLGTDSTILSVFPSQRRGM